MLRLRTFFLGITLLMVAALAYQDKLEALGTVRWWNWYFPDGTVDKGGTDPKQLWESYGLPREMTGKRFYDLGCWDGGTCFEAVHRGATDVYGLDSFVWEINPQTHANFLYAKERIAPFVKEAYVEIEPVQSKHWESNSMLLPNKHSIVSFAKECGTADVVLAAGIFYHLVDPIKFIHDLKALVTPNTGRIYLTTWCSRENAAVAHFVPGWRNDSSNYWLFSITCMMQLLTETGYTIEAVHEVFPGSEPLMSFVLSVLT